MGWRLIDSHMDGVSFPFLFPSLLSHSITGVIDRSIVDRQGPWQVSHASEDPLRSAPAATIPRVHGRCRGPCLPWGICGDVG